MAILDLWLVVKGNGIFPTLRLTNLPCNGSQDGPQVKGRIQWRDLIYKGQERNSILDCKAGRGASKLVRRYAAVRDYTCVVKALLGQGVAFTKSDAGCRSQGRNSGRFQTRNLNQKVNNGVCLS
jgi:hypothetical protein